MINPHIATYKRRPLVLFPEGWKLGWMDPDIKDGEIPIYFAEAFLAKATLPPGDRSKFPFTKLPTTAKEWSSFRAAYYSGLCTSPWGYKAPGESFSPWGMSIHGVPKLHPSDL